MGPCFESSTTEVWWILSFGTVRHLGLRPALAPAVTGVTRWRSPPRLRIRFTAVPRSRARQERNGAGKRGGAAGRLGNSYPVPTDWPVELLMERQRLAMASPPHLWVIMDEAALRRQVGGRETTRLQIEHLIELSSMPTVFLQLIPFSRGEYAAMDLPFNILGFPDQADPDVACAGYPTGLLWIEDAAEVDRYNLIFHHLQAVALSPAESVALMVATLKEQHADADGPPPRMARISCA